MISTQASVTASHFATGMACICDAGFVLKSALDVYDVLQGTNMVCYAKFSCYLLTDELCAWL